MMPTPVRTVLLLSLAAGSPAFAEDYTCAHCRLEAPRPAPASEDGERAVPGFDPQTGRDLLNYPPHRLVDHLHMKLVIDIPDMNTPAFDAVQTLTVAPISAPVSELTLNAALLDIKSVTVEGYETAFAHEDGRLRITFSPPLPVGRKTDIVTAYSLFDPPFGLTWTPESPAWPGRPAQVHTQGQPETNRYWFPCHDFPNERLTTELIVTVPGGYTVSANGRLVEHRKAVDTKEDRLGRTLLRGRETFHWLQDKPHVNYLVSLVIGQFDVVDIGTPELPMPVYVPPGRGPDVPATYGNTAEMVDFFSRIIDEPYPWDRYAQLVVWNFGAGGMENTSATTMHDTAIFSAGTAADNDLDGLIAHELAHQWFGDLITCNSWEHIWLNEGFATYFSTLWMGYRDGPDAYQASLLGSFDGLVANDKPDAPYQPAMASKVYDHPWDVFGRKANPYPKGAAVLHMLRMKLGDEVFFRGLALYVDRYKFKTVETPDLRKILEEVSGENLEQFFAQWCSRPGVPRLDVEHYWDSAASELVITVRQTQNIDDANPAFEFDLPLWMPARGVPTAHHTLPVRGRETSARIKLLAEPDFIAVDPALSVLAGVSLRQPTSAWIAQLERGPSHASRARAAIALRDDASAESADALARVAADPAAFKALRAEAVRSLAHRKLTERLLALLADPLLETEARLAAAESLPDAAGGTARAAAIAELERLATTDPSERVRAAAVRSLGRMKSADSLPILLQAARTESQNDRVRQAAIQSLADLDVPQALDAAMTCARPGMLNRTRPIAIDAIARLAHHDPEAAYIALARCLRDRERRAWEAAGRALVRLADPRALDEFDQLAQLHRDPSDLAQFKAWSGELRAKAGEPEAAPSASR